jgi:hypothetical protein
MKDLWYGAHQLGTSGELRWLGLGPGWKFQLPLGSLYRSIRPVAQIPKRFLDLIYWHFRVARREERTLIQISCIGRS